MTIHWYQLLFQIINFGILVFVLNKFLYKPIVTIVNQRNKKIEDSIKAAEDNLKEKTKIEEIKKQARAEAEKEAVKIIENAKKEANKTSKNILNTAKEEAELEVDKKLAMLTEKLNEQERKITNKITDLVIKATSKVLKGSLTTTEQKKIIDLEIKQLKTIK
ncbi:MAG: F0F1 ATP synthase subunit B, partial [Candidatus Beckwithbacteria bacterium]